MGELLTRPFAGGSAPSDMSRVRGIVLAGTYHWSGSAFEDLLPRPLVPVAQAPLVSYALRWLRDGGISRATLCANSASRAMRSYLGAGSRLTMSLEYHEDWTPRGAAGCVRDAATRTDADTLVVDRRHRHPRGQHRPPARRPPDGGCGRHHRGAPRPPGALGRASAQPGRDLRLRPAGARLHPRDGLPGHQGEPDPEALPRGGARRDACRARRLSPRPERRDLPRREPLDDRADRRRPLSAGALGHVRGDGEVLAHPTAWVAPGARLVGPVLLGPSVKIAAGRHDRGSDQPGGGDVRGRRCARLALRGLGSLPDRCRRGRGRLRAGRRRGGSSPHPPLPLVPGPGRGEALGLRERFGDDEAAAEGRASDTVPGLALP